MKSLILAAVMLLTSACGGPPPRVEVTLERRQCFLAAGCSAYQVHVALDGTISSEGRSLVKELGARTAMLDAPGLQALRLAVARADVDEFKDAYTPGACPDFLTERATVTLTVAWDGSTKRIEHHHGCEGLPELERLTKLEDTIDEILGTRRWVR